MKKINDQEKRERKRERDRKYYAEHKEEKSLYNMLRTASKKKYDKGYYKSVKETKRRKWLEETKPKRQAYQMMKLYGITPQEKQILLEKQGGVCAICGGDNNGNEFDIDHIHDESKRIRGLLCRDCNHGLGKFKDNKSILTRAIEYLRKMSG